MFITHDRPLHAQHAGTYNVRYDKKLQAMLLVYVHDTRNHVSEADATVAQPLIEWLDYLTDVLRYKSSDDRFKSTLFCSPNAPKYRVIRQIIVDMGLNDYEGLTYLETRIYMRILILL